MREKVLQKKFKIVCLLLFFFISQGIYSQLANFTLTVTKTDETCTGNGTLNFTATNTSFGATLLYSIYLLPDTINPLSVLSGNDLTGLVSGTYRVVALQSLGNLSNTQQQDIQIINQITPLTYQITGQPIDCINGNLTVNVLHGNPATYEIISGPTLVPPQSSNIFQGLGVGVYVVRVNDICGDGIVQTYTLIGATTMTIGVAEQGCHPLNCDTTPENFQLSTNINAVISYPLEVELTLFSPNGDPPIVFNQTITSGAANSQTVNFNLPLLDDLVYTYNIKVSDACGGVFTSNGNHIIKETDVIVSPTPRTIDNPSYLSIDTCNMSPPYTVHFLSAPAGFDPFLFNSNHPGPFTSAPIIYASNSGNELPLGEYNVEVTDGCNQVQSGLSTLPACVPENSVALVCATFGIVEIKDVISVMITAAPYDFNHPLPYDVSANIQNGIFHMQLALGFYTFRGVFLCGGLPQDFAISMSIKVPIFSAEGSNETGCAMNTGSIHVKYESYFTGLNNFMSGIEIVQAPSNFNPPLPYNVIADFEHLSAINITGLPPGDYVLKITDNCGNVYFATANVPITISESLPSINLLRGCEDGFGSIFMYGPNGEYQQVQITNAPASFNHSLPFDVSYNISAYEGAFSMNGLPEGTYIFATKDACGVSLSFPVVIPGYHVIQSDVIVRGNCGSFDLILNHVMDQPYMQGFWLQKFNPITNQWEHPYTGVPYYSGTQPNSTNSYQVFNYNTNFNIAALGTFRVIKNYSVYSNGTLNFTTCNTVVIKEFEFTGELKLTAANTILCSGGSYGVSIVADGIAPFTYKITSKDGQPFFVDNGSSNNFSGLAPGVYNFQVQDLCGNIVNRLFDIATLLEPVILPKNLCDGQNGQLSVQPISYLSYQWWNGNDPSTILSSTNVVHFNPFSNSTTPGTYYVRLYSTSTLSCIDRTISYTIPTVSNPKAGDDTIKTICGNSAAVNLFSLLGGTYDANGYWQEMSNSGVLTGNVWTPNGIPFGVYKFKYHVDGFCTDFDEAIVTINYNAIPSVPIINVNQEVCNNESIYLNITAIPNATFQWTGPNGFTSNEQNPIVENAAALNTGLYTVKAILNECESSAAVAINVQALPDFTIESRCVNNMAMLMVIPTQNSFNADDASYFWSGPNSFTSTENPVAIAQFGPGKYSVKVVDSQGCSLSKDIQVVNTLCTAPLGISPNGDEFNQNYDLRGFGEILKFKIFSRYGNIVYEQDDYTNQWHGQDFNDHELPDATYFYYIKLKSGEEKTGWVYVTK